MNAEMNAVMRSAAQNEMVTLLFRTIKLAQCYRKDKLYAHLRILFVKVNFTEVYVNAYLMKSVQIYGALRSFVQ